jgi:hypothetical protein
MAIIVKPGEKPPKPGEYKPVGPRGGNVPGDPVTIDVNEGHMPPTPNNGQRWRWISKPQK